MDSGAFTRITSGKGHLPVDEYAAIINKYWRGNKYWRFDGVTNGKPHKSIDESELPPTNELTSELVAAVTQDYMCEPFVLGKTGLDIPTHQSLTIENYDKLHWELSKSSLLADHIMYSSDLDVTEDDLFEAYEDDMLETDVYIMPVLQGYAPEDYVNHLEQYGDRIDKNAWVGVGSVCKRNGNPAAITAVLMAIKSVRPDLKLHGFGIKKRSLVDPNVWALLYSADSQAHGLWGGKGSYKYVEGRHDPNNALRYWKSLEPPEQLSLFSTGDL